jgi:LacI family transcriptional regulator
VIRALQDEGPGVFRQLVTVGLELTDETRSGLIDGVLKLVLAHPMKLLAETVVNAMVRVTEGSAREPFTQCLLPFDIYTPENL